jgi:hypothetical protein
MQSTNSSSFTHIKYIYSIVNTNMQHLSTHWSMGLFEIFKTYFFTVKKFVLRTFH